MFACMHICVYASMQWYILCIISKVLKFVLQRTEYKWDINLDQQIKILKSKGHSPLVFAAGWSSLPKGSSLKRHLDEGRRGWIGGELSGANPPVFSVVEFISCTSLRGSYENYLVGGCFLICYCSREEITPRFPSRSTASFDILTNPGQMCCSSLIVYALSMPRTLRLEK